MQQNSTLESAAGISAESVMPDTGGIPQQTQVSQEIQWVTGPAKVVLAGVAELELPEGYKFADKGNASALLERMRNQVPPNLVGMLISPSGDWFALLELSGTGYVRDHDWDQLDPETILNSVRQIAARQNVTLANLGLPIIGSLDWAHKPVYDTAAHRLEWGIKAESQGRAVVNYIVRLLGRTSVLDFVGVVPDAPGLDLTPVQTVARGISFNASHRYEDYQPGDKVADLSLAQLIISEHARQQGQQAEQAVPAVASPLSGRLLWAGVVFGLVLLTGAGLAVMALTRSNRARTVVAPAAAGDATKTIETAQAPVTKAVTTEQGLLQRSHERRTGEGLFNRNRKRRKRFKFDAFYSQMIMRLSGADYLAGPDNGEREMLLAQQACPLADRTRVLDVEKAIVTRAAALIENQTNLIEVQRKFIEEQNRLIEEQRRLLCAETELHKSQLELFSK